MSPNGLSDEVYDFIVRHLSSFEQLEVLLFLQAHPRRAYGAADVASELRTSLFAAEQCLRHLAERGLTSDEQGRARYGPADPALDRAVRALVAAYRERRVSVINVIFDPRKSPR